MICVNVIYQKQNKHISNYSQETITPVWIQLSAQITRGFLPGPQADARSDFLPDFFTLYVICSAGICPDCVQIMA